MIDTILAFIFLFPEWTTVFQGICFMFACIFLVLYLMYTTKEW